MRFSERLAAGKFAVALEITPPQRALPRVLLRRARLLGDSAHAVNIIQRPERQASLDACLALLEEGIEPVWHLVTRGRSRRELEDDLARARAGGVHQLLCIRGEHPGADAPDTPSLPSMVAMAAKAMPGTLVGATFNQYAGRRDVALRNLAAQIAAGACYVQTQPVFEAGNFERAAEQIARATPGTSVVPMVMPLCSREEAARMAQRLSIALPERFLRRLDTPSNAWEAFGETLAALFGSELVAGIAIMTFEMDPPAETGERIVRALRAAGIE